MQGEQENSAGAPAEPAASGATSGTTGASAGGGTGGAAAAKVTGGSSPNATDTASVVTAAFRDIIAPLVRADGGHLYLLSVTRDEVHVHLTGTCAGCPGAFTTRDKMMAPILSSVAPNMQIRLTTGWSVPDGAKELE